MYIWYVSLYEPLPIDGIDVRKMRTGWICNSLLEEKSLVELWIPGFDHIKHEHFKKESANEIIRDGFSVQYLKGIGYETDTSPKRFFHNKYLANEFRRISSSRKIIPDLIITQIPSLELAEEVIKFAKKHKIPSIVDIRDLWPDIYKRLLPSKLDWLYKVLFFKEILRLKFILKNCTEITAISSDYLKWGEKYSKRKIKSSNIFYIGYCKTEVIDKTSWYEFLKSKNIPNKKKIYYFFRYFLRKL